MISVIIAFFHIGFDDAIHFRIILVRQFTNDLSRPSHSHCMGWDFFAWRHEASCSYKSTFTYFCTIQNNRPHTNEGAFPDNGGMQGNLMSYCHINLKNQWVMRTLMQHG